MKFLLCLFATIIICSVSINAQSKLSEELQRQPVGDFDLQKNTKSNFEFYQTNYGIFGFDLKTAQAGGFWPRGSSNQYLFASGFWLGAKKTDPLSGELKKMVLISYNPNSGRSWMSPGRIEDGDTLMNDMSVNKYRVYFSTDMYAENGVPKIESDGPNWPLWVTDPLRKYHYGVPLYDYVFDESKRNLQNYPEGPLFISEEDLITVFKDTDLRLYEGGASRANMGYPLRMQFESHIYSWGQGDMHDVVIQYYVIENKSSETYKDCWFAGVYDPDIALSSNALNGASNDRVRYFEEEDLNLVVAWTDTSAGEGGHGFGYMGITLLQSPAVDANGYLRTDKLLFEPKEQLGLVTFKSWGIQDDILSDNARYDYISNRDIDIQENPVDVRTILATGPFHLRPNDKARIAFAMNFALPAKGGEADGTFEDIAGFVDKTKGGDDEQLQGSENNSLVGKIKQVYKEYYENIASKVIQSESYQNFGKVYPNPASEYIAFDYTLSTDTQLKIVLVDELGRDIVELFNNHRISGNYHHFFDLNKLNLPNGAYFIRTESNKGSNMTKFILAK
ncbi:MAG: T9SS type A sorting domain-containing protein [Desulfobulbaceae bacterium]|nr:T9SS type A sorting domain-containing protein [Candidatus Kapabacteria bacterium]MBS4000215.1 T9SS type A sorting domain-containing protein [Desulfobulbaceae bacterium]